MLAEYGGGRFASSAPRTEVWPLNKSAARAAASQVSKSTPAREAPSRANCSSGRLPDTSAFSSACTEERERLSLEEKGNGRRKGQTVER